MQQPISARRSGFTLVELLIVIGVIVVLIALLLPSVASVRARARSVEAQSNLAQLGLALNAANRNRSTPVMHTDSDGILWTKQIQPFLEGENEALFVSPADPNAEERGSHEPSFAANNQMHRMGSGDGRKRVILDFEEGDAQDGIFEAAPDSNGDPWTDGVDENWQNALDAAGQRQGGNVNVLRHDGSVSSESAQDLMDYHPQNSPEDWKPWRTDNEWICPPGQDCSPPEALVTDLTPDVPVTPPGDTPEDPEDPPYEDPPDEEDTSGPPDPYEPCKDEPVDPTGASEKALEWLVAQQQDDGSWLFTGGYPGGATGAALLALLGSGHTPFSGTYKQEVCDGLKFLLSYQGPDGSFEDQGMGSSAEGGMYGHQFAQWAVAESVILSEKAQNNGCDEGCDLTIAQLTEAGNRGVQLTVDRKASGGWIYGGQYNSNGDGYGDTSQLFLGVITLLASQEAGFKTFNVFTDLGLYGGQKVHLEKFGQPGHEVTDPNSGITVHTHYAYGDYRCWHGCANEDTFYDAGGAMGLLSRVVTSKLNGGSNFGLTGAIPAEHKAVEEFFQKADNASANCDMYYLKNATYLAYMRGGDVWSQWNTALVSMLTETQNPDGSWDFNDCPDNINAFEKGGPVFYTSWAILSLGAGYAGLQIFD